MISPWIEAMRLRTLPVSAASVVMALAVTAASGPIDWLWAVVCLVFAVLCQVACNFANEYFDVRDGIDATTLRRGPQRGIIAPRQMLRATILTLAAACAVGLITLWRGGLWLLPAGAFIALGALAYSAGPWPLSRHRLGELAVVVFYGLVPVSLTYYLQCLDFTPGILWTALGVGLFAAMVVLVNNYRDINADRAVGKNTLSTALGPQGSALLYCALGQFAAVALMLGGDLVISCLAIAPAAMGFYGGWLMWKGLPAFKATNLLAVTATTLLDISIVALVINILV